MLVIALTQSQNLVRSHKVCMGSPLSPVSVPLESILTLKLNLTAQLGVVGKLVRVQLIPQSLSLTKVLNCGGPSANP